jgi:sugar O-acyltransferase (sialic acid O-acetyltransferase NeuD family)
VFTEIVELCSRKGIEIAYGVDPRVKSGFPFPILPKETELTDLLKDKICDYSFALVPDSPEARQRIFEHFGDNRNRMIFPSIIDENVMFSPSASIGKGSIILGGSLVSSNTVIENFVKLNFFSRVHHDAHIDNYSTIAPGATILGNVKVGKRVYVGANATLLPGITVGDGAVIGAGSVVTRNVDPQITVMGVPAKFQSFLFNADKEN